MYSAVALLNIVGREKVPISHMVVEMLLGEMFRLPAQRYPEVFFTAMLIELCKVQPGTVPQVVSFGKADLISRAR